MILTEHLHSLVDVLVHFERAKRHGLEVGADTSHYPLRLDGGDDCDVIWGQQEMLSMFDIARQSHTVIVDEPNDTSESLHLSHDAPDVAFRYQ